MTSFNLYDTNTIGRNAIQVKNIARTQVGHLPRNVVSKLSPLLDQGVITVEGVINDGNCEFLLLDTMRGAEVLVQYPDLGDIPFQCAPFANTSIRDDHPITHTVPFAYMGPRT